MTTKNICILLSGLLFTLPSLAQPSPALLNKNSIPTYIANKLLANTPVELIVEYDANAIEREATTLRIFNGALTQDDATITAFRAGRYATLKRAVDSALPNPDIEAIADYSHLPMTFKRFHSLRALQAYLAHTSVVAAYENTTLHHALTVSLPFIGQPAVAAAGASGAGTTVAVLDDGIDYTIPAFGSCTAPATPASCHVAVSQNFGTGTTDTSHGTNVAAIVLGVAPATKIAALNVFSGTTAYSSNVVAAINWSIANKTTYNIVAINMSLGDSSSNTSACSSGNVFRTPVTNSRSAGISVVAASGNDAYTNAIAKPACTPGVISVGAVYDNNYGGIGWGSGLCTDNTTAADQVTCFSNSASFLTMLAPGALITAGGFTEGGTSQASPHVAGAIAVLRAAYPTETLDQSATRLTSSGVMVTDARNNIVKPRLNLLAAARPANDNFSNRITISGASGNTAGNNTLASKESGENNHANNSGGHSAWWKWTAPAAGQVSLDTHGSNFDTLLAVYTGSAVNALTSITANDNDSTSGGVSSVLFQAQAGMEYEIAVDGTNASSGAITLNWSLNTTAQANLSVNASGPNTVAIGAPSTYTMSVTNTGPQTATHVVATVTLPTGANFVSGSTNCTASGTTVICAVDTLANSATIDFNIVLTWSSSNSISLPVTVSSDLPDPSSGNNSTVVQTQIIDSGNDNDVPILPNWGMALLAALLSATIFRKGNRWHT